MKKVLFGIVFIFLSIMIISTAQSAQLPNEICFNMFAGQFCFNETSTTWDLNNSAAYYNAGRVGVGTDDPESELQVTGGGLCVGSDANCNSDNNVEGTVYSSSTSMTQYDLAENFPTRDSLEPGDVVVFYPQSPIFVKLSTTAYDPLYAGIVSTNPGALLGGFNGWQYIEEVQVPVALAGRVPTKVSNINGDIRVGDLLSTSSLPGYAMKLRLEKAADADDFKELKRIIDDNEDKKRSIIGKALEPCEEMYCTILVKVNP